MIEICKMLHHQNYKKRHNFITEFFVFCDGTKLQNGEHNLEFLK